MKKVLVLVLAVSVVILVSGLVRANIANATDDGSISIKWIVGQDRQASCGFDYAGYIPTEPCVDLGLDPRSADRQRECHD